MKENGLEAIIVAAAGVHRLGLKEAITEYLPPNLFLPAIGQGALGIEIRDDDKKIKGLRISWEGDFLDIDSATGQKKPFILSDPNTEAINPCIATTYSPIGDNGPDEDGKVLITWQVYHEKTQNIWGVMYTPPEPPLLQWVGTEHFEEDGVHPDSGEGGDEFTFKVKYKQSEEGSSEPLVSLVLIDLNRNGFYEQNERFGMEAEGEDSSVYQTEEPILYNGDPNDPDSDKVAYKFYFQDEFNMAIGDPNAVGDPAGDHVLTVGKKDHVPRLSWLGTGNYMQDGLHPDKIEVDANSNFTLK